jgi:hypothetical protein
MSNVAVLIAGDFREFALAVKSWSFARSADLFLATWETTQDENSHLGFVGSRQVDLAPVVSLLKASAVLPVSCPVPSVPAALDTREPGQLRLQILQRAAIDLMRSYEAARGVLYDTVVVIRPDLFLGAPLDIPVPESNQFFHFAFHEWKDAGVTRRGSYVGDFVFIMHRRGINELLDYHRFYRSNPQPCPHTAWGDFFAAHDWIDHIPMWSPRYCIARGNSAVLSKAIANERQAFAMFDEINRRTERWMSLKYKQ